MNFVERHSKSRKLGGDHGFTLIEIMVALAIVALFLGIGVPAFVRSFTQQGIARAVSDTVEACNQARAQAITTGVPSELVFSPNERTFRVIAGKGQIRSDDPEFNDGPLVQIPNKSYPLPEGIQIELLGVNFREIQENESARVRFYPNSTSDEFTVIYRSEQNEVREVTLELVTGLARVRHIK